ncbi:hypothetical protein Tco_0465807, partial [Tanacetum coccineum]
KALPASDKRGEKRLEEVKLKKQTKPYSYIKYLSYVHSAQHRNVEHIGVNGNQQKHGNIPYEKGQRIATEQRSSDRKMLLALGVAMLAPMTEFLIHSVQNVSNLAAMSLFLISLMLVPLARNPLQSELQVKGKNELLHQHFLRGKKRRLVTHGLEGYEFEKTCNNDKNLSEVQLEHEKEDELVAVVVKVVHELDYMVAVKEIENELLEEVGKLQWWFEQTLMMKEKRMKKVKVVVKYENWVI